MESSPYSAETAKIAIAIAIVILENKPPNVDVKEFVDELANRLFGESSDGSDSDGTATTVYSSDASDSSDDEDSTEQLLQMPFDAGTGLRQTRSFYATRVETFNAIRAALRVTDMMNLVSVNTLECNPIFLKQLNTHLAVISSRIEADDWDTLSAVFPELCVMLESLPLSADVSVGATVTKFVRALFVSALVNPVEPQKTLTKRGRGRAPSKRSHGESDKNSNESSPGCRRSLIREMCEATKSLPFICLLLSCLAGILNDVVQPRMIEIVTMCSSQNQSSVSSGSVSAAIDAANWVCLVCQVLLSKPCVSQAPDHFRRGLRTSFMACKSAVIDNRPDFAPIFSNALTSLIALCDR